MRTAKPGRQPGRPSPWRTVSSGPLSFCLSTPALLAPDLPMATDELAFAIAELGHELSLPHEAD